MFRMLLFIMLCLGLYILVDARRFRLPRYRWRDGNFDSDKKRLTMFDVRRLLIKGERGLAIRVYCELFKTSPEDASAAVDEIERSIQPKDFGF